MNRLRLLAVVPVCFLFGCGGGADKPPSYANVSGTVTFNGKPLEKGTITFSTDGRPPSLMDVVDGKFSGQAMVGSNKVAVSAKRKSSSGPNIPPQAKAMAEAQMKAYAERPPGSQGGGGGGQITNIEIGTEEIIPPEWGTATKQMRVVEAGATNKFEFDIKGK